MDWFSFDKNSIDGKILFFLTNQMEKFIKEEGQFMRHHVLKKGETFQFGMNKEDIERLLLSKGFHKILNKRAIESCREYSATHPDKIKV